MTIGPVRFEIEVVVGVPLKGPGASGASKGGAAPDNLANNRRSHQNDGGSRREVIALVERFSPWQTPLAEHSPSGVRGFGRAMALGSPESDEFQDDDDDDNHADDVENAVAAHETVLSCALGTWWE